MQSWMYVATVSLTSIYLLAKVELHALAKSMLTKLYTLDKGLPFMFYSLAKNALVHNNSINSLGSEFSSQGHFHTL